MNFEIKKLSETAKTPTVGTAFSAGFDLYSDEEIIIPANSRKLVSTGLSMAIPNGYYGKIFSRSSVALKKNTDVAAGVIDSDYRGEVKVLLHNTSHQDYQIYKYDRIAQLILHKIITPTIILVDELSETNRGDGGFGSTGA